MAAKGAERLGGTRRRSRAMNLDHLGAPLRPMTRVHGKGFNRLTHRDIHPWNLLARGGRPVVLDWELSGALELASELGSTALSLSKGPGFDDIDRVVFRSVLDGYVAGGGALPPPGPSWFVFMIGGWLGFTHWNIVRCLAGVESPTGPDLAQCHDEVRNGLRGLPDLYRRLPELEDLLD